jgi:hypothetical protein
MLRLLPRRVPFEARRLFSTGTARTAFATGPSPPRLPPKEQEEFERLQRSSTGAFSTPKSTTAPSSTPSSAAAQPTRPQINQSPASTPVDKEETVDARVAATGKGEELHPDIRRGAKPEFEGEVNPKTGEVGGPKNEPLRWGSTGERGDWSYNGRVTDF